MQWLLETAQAAGRIQATVRGALSKKLSRRHMALVRRFRQLRAVRPIVLSAALAFTVKLGEFFTSLNVVCTVSLCMYVCMYVVCMYTVSGSSSKGCARESTTDDRRPYRGGTGFAKATRTICPSSRRCNEVTISDEATHDRSVSVERTKACAAESSRASPRHCCHGCVAQIVGTR